MIPVSLSFSAFGPYLTRQEISFAPFLKSGLMLIRGETGAGKTALLDAMTYALYGRSSGGGRGDLASMRCLAAGPDQETRVEYRFRVRGKEYFFTRWLRVKKKRNGQLEYDNAQNVFYVDENGVDIPFFANPKIRDLDAKAQELIGLTYDQFRQVMILPQGQFERLLTSKSDEKEAILTTLFHAQRWDKIAQWLSNQSLAKRNALQEEAAVLEGALGNCGAHSLEELGKLAEEQKEAQQKLLEQRAREASALEEERKKLAGEERLEELYRQQEEAAGIISQLAARAQEETLRRERLASGKAAARLEPAWVQVNRSRKEAERRKEEAGLAAAQLEKAMAVWEKAATRNQRWERQAEAWEARRTELVRLEERLPDYAQLEAARLSAEEAGCQLKARRDEYRREQEKERAAYQRREELSARREEWFSRYVQQVPVLTQEEQRLSRGEEAARQLACIRESVNRKNREIMGLEKEYERSSGLLEQLRAQEEQARRSYRKEVLTQLAQELGEGEACPLCGSVHHPRLYGEKEASCPTGGNLEQLGKRLRFQEEETRRQEQALLAARMEKKNLEGEEERLGQEAAASPANPAQLEELRSRLARAKEKAGQFDQLLGELRQAEAGWAEAQRRLEQLRLEGTAANEAEQKARARWESLQNRIEPGIPNEAALRQQVAVLRRELEKEKKEREQDRSALEDATVAREKADAVSRRAGEEAIAAGREWELSNRHWQAACRSEGFAGEEEYRQACLPPQEISRLEEESRQFEQARQMAERQLAQAKQAIGTAEKPQTAPRRESIAQLEKDLAQRDGQLGAAGQRLAQLEKVKEEVAFRMEKLEQNRKESEKLFAFARGLRGSDGISLGRFVLGVMLSSVTAEANRLLEGVHGGRYRLYRTSEGAGRARRVGLELEVLDGFSGKRRSVASLSGGEKFLVALALALGLSAVVQAQSGGVRMEALFIDEGFGSLDPASIQDALGVLAAVAGSRRLVGIISHVEALEENISSSIRVVKGREGSRLEVRL